MTNELLPCGCGGDAGVDLTDFEWAESQSFHVKCLKCGVRTPVGTARSPISQAKAIRIWQKSHAPLSGITEDASNRIAELEKLRGDIEPIIGFGPHPVFRVINDRIALLRQQGPPPFTPTQTEE